MFNFYDLVMFDVICKGRRFVYIFECSKYSFLVIIEFRSGVCRIFGYISRVNGVDSFFYNVFFIEFFVWGLFDFLVLNFVGCSYFSGYCCCCDYYSKIW